MRFFSNLNNELHLLPKVFFNVLDGEIFPFVGILKNFSADKCFEHELGNHAFGFKSRRQRNEQHTILYMLLLLKLLFIMLNLFMHLLFETKKAISFLPNVANACPLISGCSCSPKNVKLIANPPWRPASNT